MCRGSDRITAWLRSINGGEGRRRRVDIAAYRQESVGGSESGLGRAQRRTSSEMKCHVWTGTHCRLRNVTLLYAGITSLYRNKWCFCTLMYLNKRVCTYVCVCDHDPTHTHTHTPKSNLAVTLDRPAQTTYELPIQTTSIKHRREKKRSAACVLFCACTCTGACARRWFNSLSVKRVSASDRNTATPWENSGQSAGRLNFFIFPRAAL